jgi:hypothetical protein
MSTPAPLGPREVWLGVLVSFDPARAIGRVSGSGGDGGHVFGSFAFELGVWRGDGPPQVGQSVLFVVDPTNGRVVEVTR